VFTVAGKYTARAGPNGPRAPVWVRPVASFDATGDQAFAKRGAGYTVKRMASHVSHIGVHDHGFQQSLHLRQLAGLQARAAAADQIESCELAISLKPWSCTPMCETCEAMRLTV